MTLSRRPSFVSVWNYSSYHWSNSHLLSNDFLVCFLLEVCRLGGWLRCHLSSISWTSSRWTIFIFFCDAKQFAMLEIKICYRILFESKIGRWLVSEHICQVQYVHFPISSRDFCCGHNGRRKKVEKECSVDLFSIVVSFHLNAKDRRLS